MHACIQYYDHLMLNLFKVHLLLAEVPNYANVLLPVSVKFATCCQNQRISCKSEK